MWPDVADIAAAVQASDEAYTGAAAGSAAAGSAASCSAASDADGWVGFSKFMAIVGSCEDKGRNNVKGAVKAWKHTSNMRFAKLRKAKRSIPNHIRDLTCSINVTYLFVTE